MAQTLNMSSLGDLSEMATKLCMTEEQLKAVATQLQSVAKANGASKGPRKERTPAAAECRCMARIWGDGMGAQCTHAKSGGDYCKLHAKKAAETEEPCTWKDGKRFGLWCGRVDQPLTGKDTNGKWQIIWKHPDMVAAMNAEKEAGEFKYGEAEEKKRKPVSSGKPRAPRKRKEGAEKKAKKEKASGVKKPRGKNAYMFFLDSRRAQIGADIKAAAEADGASDEDKAKLSAKGSVKVSEVTKVAGAEWKALSAEDKAPFEKQSAADKAAKIAAWEKEQAETPAETTVETPAVAAAVEAEVTSTPATPPSAPDTHNAASLKAAAKLLESLKSDEKDVFGSDTEEEEEGPWTYTLPEANALPTPADADGDFDPTNAAAIKGSDGQFYIVAMDWYEAASEEDVEDLKKLKEHNVGTVEKPKFPETEEDELEGQFVPRKA
ncbi:MAG: hypothetical protein CMK36_07560 [Porticoccaceae bacterium]|nr:hypothetical protein [Porticoccaceae bacterium]|tara:strand:- start:1573 stop:2880 length:1308 start_codon:yes stop_codon:yes gene_type:complete